MYLLGGSEFSIKRKGVKMEGKVVKRIGDVVEYVDPTGHSHNAIVTADWGAGSPTASLNLVYVSDDESETDQYGRQIKRDTSVVAEASQPAHGRFWRELD
jgi:hypothetical protein